MKTKELLVFVEDQYCGALREDGHGKHLISTCSAICLRL